VDILGVNAVDQELYNAGMVRGRVLPWLQDTTSVNAWGLWNATWRDVVVLDTLNVRVAVYNLTEHNLSRTAAYDSLKNLLLTLGGAPAR
jgi:hypothetical protein